MPFGPAPARDTRMIGGFCGYGYVLLEDFIPLTFYIYSGN